MAAGAMSLEALEVHVELGREWVIVAVKGELDILTSPDLAAVLEAVKGQRTQMVVDMAMVRFVDAHGLRVLAEGATAMPEGFVITCPPPLLRRLLAITGLESAVELRDHRPRVTGYHRALRF